MLGVWIMHDQTIKTDAGKPRLTLVPTQIIRDIATVREYGVDAESGLPHLHHIACNVAFLCELMKEGAIWTG